MKKFNLVIVALLILSVSAFAVDFEPEVTVSGEASVTFTYDLETGYVDLENAASANVVLQLIAESSVEEGEGDVVGWIKISGIEASIEEDNNLDVLVYDEDGNPIDQDDDGDIDGDDLVTLPSNVISAPDVEARIYLMGPMLHIDITNVGADTDFAGEVDFNDDYQLDGAETMTDVAASAADTGSVSLVYDAELFNARVTLSDADADAGNDFDLGFAFGLTAVEGLTLNAGASYLYNDGTAIIGYGAEVGYDLEIASVSVAVDGNDSSDFQILATVGVDVGATVDVTFGTDTVSESQELIVTASTGSLVEMVTLSATLEFDEFEDLGVLVDASADLGVVSPYATVSFYDVAAVQTIGLTVGTGIAVIENVALDLNYSSDDVENDNGAVEFSATISY
jgi:hypothetical protein